MTVPAAAFVSRVMGRRFARSTSAGSAVRGYRTNTAGFVVTTYADHVRIEHREASGYRARNEATIDAHNDRVCSYAAWMRAEGFTAEVHRNGTGTSTHDSQGHVRVTERKIP